MAAGTGTKKLFVFPSPPNFRGPAALPPPSRRPNDIPPLSGPLPASTSLSAAPTISGTPRAPATSSTPVTTAPVLPPAKKKVGLKQRTLDGGAEDAESGGGSGKRIPGFHPVNEWQIARQKLVGDDTLSLIVQLRVHGTWTAQLAGLLKKHDVPHLRVPDVIDPQVHLFKFDPDAYDLVQEQIEQHPMLKAHIKPLPKELVTILDRQADPELFAFMTDEEKRQRWAQLPQTLVNTLKPFQREGVEFLWHHRDRGMIADEMGLGKTIQAITFLLSNTSPDKWPALIVTPRSVRYNWEMEWLKWCPGAKPRDVIILKDTKMVERILPRVIQKMQAEQKRARGQTEQIMLPHKRVHTQNTTDNNDEKRDKRRKTNDGVAAASDTTPSSDLYRKALDVAVETALQSSSTTTRLPASTTGVSVSATTVSAAADLDQQIAAVIAAVGQAHKSLPPVPDAWTQQTTKKKKGNGAAPGTRRMSKRQKLEAKMLDGALVGKLFIISYNLLIRPTVLALLKQARFPSIVLDESHSCKHITSQRTKACLELARRTERLALLSGTPASRPAELYPQIKMIHPWMFSKWWIPYPKHITTHDKARAYKPKDFTYASYFCDPKPVATRGRGGSVMWRWQTERGVSRLPVISSIVQHYVFIRRLKKQVLKQLPKLNRTRMVLVPPDAELEKAQKAMDKLEELPEGSREHDLMFNDIFDKQLPKLKWPLVEEYFREQFTDGDLAADPSIKCLIFAHHHEFLHKLDDLLTELNVPHVLMYGETPSEQRKTGTQRFQESPASECRVAILGIKAFKEGVNFDKASRVYMAELQWGPEDMLQAEARAHRMNSERVVDVEYLLVKSTMDMVTWRQLDKKQTQADVIADERYLQDPRNAAPSLPSRYVVSEAPSSNDDESSDSE